MIADAIASVVEVIETKTAMINEDDMYRRCITISDARKKLSNLWYRLEILIGLRYDYSQLHETPFNALIIVIDALMTMMTMMTMIVNDAFDIIVDDAFEACDACDADCEARENDIGDMCVNPDFSASVPDLYLYRSAAKREEHKLSKLYLVLVVFITIILSLPDLYLYRSAAEREEHKLPKLYMVLVVFITIILNMTLIWKM